MTYTLQELEQLNALYKPKIAKEWHRYCWFIAKSVKNNNNMMCKYCKIVLKGAKSRFLEHLGGYEQDVRECPSVTSDAKTFAKQCGKGRIQNAIKKKKRTNAIINDDMKMSARE